MGTRNAERTKSKIRRQERLRRQLQSQAARGEVTVDQLAEHSPASCSSTASESPSGCAPSSRTPQKDAPQDRDGLFPEGTSSVKQVAAAALILGQNVTKTAEALGVDRRTVQRWSKYDPEFQEALKEAKLEVVITSRQSLLALAEHAVDKVEAKLTEEQNPRDALALLRGMGILNPQLPVPVALAEGDADLEKRVQSATLASLASAKKAGGEGEEPGLSQAEQAVLEAEEVCEWSDLLPQQKIAVTNLFAGKPVSEVAELCATTEATIRGWLCRDLRFFTLLSELQLDRLTRLKFRLLNLTAEATNIVRRAIQGGNGRVAMSLLRGLGLLM